MEEQTLFSWIHLSDIHIGHGDRGYGWNQKLVLEALRRDVAGKPGPDHVDWILVTGDIAFSGAGRSPDEYVEAARWLKSVAEAASVPPSWIWLVPGNHDVNRGADGERSVGRAVDALRSGNEQIDGVLADKEDRARLAKRQTAYLEFATSFAPWALEGNAPAPEDRLFWMRRIKRPDGARVRLVGFNTALVCKDDTDLGKLQMGNMQLHGALSTPVDEGEIVICLSHHPLTAGWLSDEKDALGWIRRNAHLHLSGHVHEAESGELRSGAGGHFVHVVAGAAHGDKMPPGVPAGHGYNYGEIVHVGGGTLELRVWPRHWSEPNKEFRADVDNVPRENMERGLPYATHTLRARLPWVAPAATKTPAATTTTAATTTMAAVETPPAVTAPVVETPPPAVTAPAVAPTEVFYVYARADADMVDKLDTHLALLKKTGVITRFDRREIAAGAESEAEILEHVRSARVFLVMISASFIASEFFDGPLMDRIMERRKQGATVIPIYLKPCDWEETKLASLQMLPREAERDRPVPISKLDQDEAFKDIAYELRTLLRPAKKR